FRRCSRARFAAHSTTTRNGLRPLLLILSAKRLERGSHLLREELGLFPGGEVAALADLVEVGDVGVGVLDPAARGPPDLAGECGEADAERDFRRGLTGSASFIRDLYV